MAGMSFFKLVRRYSMAADKWFLTVLGEMFNRLEISSRLKPSCLVAYKSVAVEEADG